MGKLIIKNNEQAELSIEHKAGSGALTLNSADFIKKIDTVAKLRELVERPEFVHLTGYHEKGDGAFGSHFFKWNPTSEEDDNSGTILKLNGVDIGRYKLQYDGAVNVRWFGAKKDGVSDQSATFMSVMNYVSNNPSITTIDIPEGVFIVDNIRVPTGVILKGVAPMNGWARLSGKYTKGSVLKLKDGSNKNVIFIEKDTQNCGIMNLIIDGNKANQTNYGSNCLYIQATDFRAFGVVISGNKFVNAKGWGVYCNSTGPIEFEDNFVMSGALFSGISDYKIRGNTFDGTDGLHPALLMHRARHGLLSDNIIYGWGEDGTTDKTLQTTEVTIDVSTNILTATDMTWLYEGAPIVMSSTANIPTVNGASSHRIYWVSQISGDTFKLESNIPVTSGSTTVDFSDAGTGIITIGHGGSNLNEEVARFDICDTMGESNNRIAGAKGSQLVMNLCNDIKKSNGVFYSSNWRGLNNIPALEMIDCQRCGFSTNNLGGLVSELSKYDYIVRLTDSYTTSKYNKFDMSNNYLQSITGILIKDETVQSYKDRNIFDGIDGIADAGTQRIESKHFFNQPHKNVISALFTTKTIPSDTVTRLPLVGEIELGGTVNAEDIELETTADGLYHISGQITIEGHNSAISYAMVTISGFSSSIRPIRRFSAPVDGNSSNRFSIPFNFYTQSTSDKNINLTWDVYLSSDAGSGTIIQTSSEYSFITIIKVSETTPNS